MVHDSPPSFDAPTVHDCNSDANVPLSAATESELLEFEREIEAVFNNTPSESDLEAEFARYQARQDIAESEALTPKQEIQRINAHTAQIRAVTQSITDEQDDAETIVTCRAWVCPRESWMLAVMLPGAQKATFFWVSDLPSGYESPLAERIRSADLAGWNAQGDTPGLPDVSVDFTESEIAMIVKAAEANTRTKRWEPIPVIQPITTPVYQLDPTKWARQG